MQLFMAASYALTDVQAIIIWNFTDSWIRGPADENGRWEQFLKLHKRSEFLISRVFMIPNL